MTTSRDQTSAAVCVVCQTVESTFSPDLLCARCAFASALTGISGRDSSAEDSDQPSMPESFDDYEVLTELGRGATATVWMARERTLNRLVALKLIPAGADRRLAQRLVREGQAVASLRHPHIVAVHAMGLTDQYAYLAMDLLDGGDLTTKLAGRPLPPTDAASLITDLADALAHAHDAGVLHRDIKPSNILLDAEGQPLLADFGLAGPLSGGGDLTLPGQIAGTAAYLAPELLQGADRASVRSDLYSLGAVLYECLTGRAPFVGDSSASILAQIPDNEPVAPRLLWPQIPKDLETICLKCLEKIPERRYESAAALRLDLERFSRGEPVSARPVRFAGKAIRWARRRPGLATSAGIATMLLLTLAIGGPLTAVRLDRARRSVEAAKVTAEAAEAASAIDAATSREILGFLKNDVLAQASPDHQQDRDLKLRTVLDQSAKKIDGRFPGQPLVEAAIREVLAQTYESLGEYPAMQLHETKAQEIFQRVLGPDDPKTLKALASVATAYRHQGKYDEAEPLAARAFAGQKRVLGLENTDTLDSLAELAVIAAEKGRFAEAETLNLQALAISTKIVGLKTPQTLSVMNSLGTVLRNQRKYAESEKLFVGLIELCKEVFGPENIYTLDSMGELAVTYGIHGKYAEGEKIEAQLLEIRKRVLGPEHPHTLNGMQNLATEYQYQGKFAQAEALYLETMPLMEKAMGPDHPYTISLRAHLASNDILMGKNLPEAGQILLAVLAAREKMLGPDHPTTCDTIADLALVYRAQGRLAEAETFTARNLEIRTRVRGPEDNAALIAADNLSRVFIMEGKYDEAETRLRQLLAIRMKISPDLWRTDAIRIQLGNALLHRHETSAAEELLALGYSGLKSRFAPMSVKDKLSLRVTLDDLERQYRAAHETTKADQWRKLSAELNPALLVAAK
jgi:non-specific serine/threonine protein kinase/serine/threonine-protein kinase